MSAMAIFQQSCSRDYNGFAMLPVGKWRFLTFVLAAVCVVPSLSAVIVEEREYHGKRVTCVHGGAWIAQSAQGVYTRALGYEQVFTGTVQSVVEITDTDKRLEITPDEVLRGDAAGKITAIVNQACMPQNLPEIKAGDRWLFYLFAKRYLHPEANPPYITSDGLVLHFDSPSKPVSQAQNDICLLRHHSDSRGCIE
jgi:hypothetical protein